MNPVLEAAMQGVIASGYGFGGDLMSQRKPSQLRLTLSLLLAAVLGLGVFYTIVYTAERDHELHELRESVLGHLRIIADLVEAHPDISFSRQNDDGYRYVKLQRDAQGVPWLRLSGDSIPADLQTFLAESLPTEEALSGVVQGAQYDYSWALIPVVDNQQGHFSFRRHTPFFSSFWQHLGGPLIVAGFIVLWLVLWGGLSVERLLSHSRERNIELRETGKQLAKSRDDAMRANEAKSEFLARMSHELRTPLNAILGFAQLMEFSKDELSQGQQEGVDYILSSGKHLLQLVDEVLDIAKVDAGLVFPCMDTVPLKTILDSVILWIKPLADKKRLRLHRSAGNEVLVRADTQRLKQVLLNLLSNAVKYNHDGGEVRVELNYPRCGVVRINVTDTGFGLKDVDQPRVFEPFQRIEKNAAHIEGTGIGLSITKKLVLAMGGDIGLQSEYGKGSTFWFELERIVDGSLGPPSSVTDKQPAVSADAAIQHGRAR